MNVPVLMPFLVGLASAPHCLGMCGSIIGALSVSLPEPVRRSRWHMAGYVVAYNAGRLTSYAAAGALVGMLGTRLFHVISPQYGHLVMRGFAALMLIGIGLYVAGWLPRFAALETIGAPLWRRLEPLGRRLLPVRSLGHAYLFGVIWGWLPCGLVYTTLLWTASAGSAVAGALYMIAFGLGTLPAMLTAGLITGWVARFSRAPRLKRAVGLLLVIMGVASLWFQAGPMDHSMHAPSMH